MGEFPDQEYKNRTRRLGELMKSQNLDLLFISGDENFRYFSGARSLAKWGSFTRESFAILDGQNPPSLLVAEAAEDVTKTDGVYTSVESYADITTSPLEKLRAILLRLKPKGGKVGFEGGQEQRIGVPFNDFAEFIRRMSSHGFEFIDASQIIWHLRMNKSPLEVECTRQAGKALSRARQLAFDKIRAGMTEKEVSRVLGSLMYQEGADEVNFIDVNSGEPHTWWPGEKKLSPRDLLYVDAGAIVKGYTCEWARLATVGQPSPSQKDQHEYLCSIMDSMRKFMRPGVKVADVFAECNRRYSERNPPLEKWGRTGHGQGLNTTELPSVAPYEKTVLAPGMTVSNEPGFINKEGIYVWEDVYAITNDSCELLTPEPRDLRQISTS
ncbi:MAG TPA: Xaa-Pro peptidase family protein [Nitrososphaerales archaeon]|nr:Xaa-Pro peptidase family protein [Nitrososphaerales archaeon]